MNDDNPTHSGQSETDAERRTTEHIRRAVADAPPLAAAQRTKIAALFAPAVREQMREARERAGRS